MQLSNVPEKLVLPWATSGNKNPIPVNSQIGITAGAASLTDGFPPLTMTPIAAGGVPPSGLDMNGILYETSAILRWANAGGGYAFDADFANDSHVGGYPKGARVMRSDGMGYWFNTVDNNTTDPEAAGASVAGWVPDYQAGATVVAMSASSVTLTPLQYGKSLIVITGALSANLNLIFPALAQGWAIINNTTGGYSVTAKTAAGSGVTLDAVGQIVGDGTNIYAANIDSVQMVINVASLRNIPPNPSRRIQTRGYYTNGDGGSGQYYAKVGAAPGTYIDNGCTIIVPNGGNGSSAWALDFINEIALKQAGAKGDGVADDGPAIQNWISAGAANRVKLTAPSANYRIGTGVTVPLANNQSVYIDWQGSTITLDTTNAHWEQISIRSPNANNGCAITIENFNAVGVNGVAATHWGPASATYGKYVPFSLSAAKCIIRNFAISDVWGFAIKTSYISDVRIYNGRVSNVGGHSYTYAADAYGNADSFGDAFYIDYVCSPATVDIHDVIAVGMLNDLAPALNQTTGPVSNVSRAFLTIENSAIDGVITVKLTDYSATNYQRMHHFEALGSDTVQVEIRDFVGQNGGVLVHNYQTEGATVSITGHNVSYANSLVERFINSYGFGGHHTANYFGGNFYNIYKPFDGDVDDNEAGYLLTISDASIYFNNSRFQSAGGSINCKSCNILDYSTENSNAALTTSFQSCVFNTTIAGTHGTQLAPSGGPEYFLDCTFYNQQPSIANGNNVIRAPKYVTDQGSSLAMRINANAQGKQIPKIWNCLYRVTDLTTGTTTVTWINEAGVIYAISGAVALVAGTYSYTVGISTNVNASNIQIVEIIPCGKAI